MLISVTAICTCASPSTSNILGCWSPSCARRLSTRSRLSFVRLQHSEMEMIFLFFNFYFYSPPPPPPLTHTHWQLPGFRGVKACIIFHQLSVRYRQKRLLWNSLTACSLAWTSLMSDCSLFLAWTRRSGDGFARQMQLCVCEGVKLHKKADWMEKVSIMRTSNQSKTKAHMKKVLGLLWLVWVVRLVSWQGVSVSVHINFSGRQL